MTGDLGGHLLFAFGAFGLAAFLCWTLWAGEFPIKKGPTFTRKNAPIMYWSLTIVFAIFSIVSVLFALALLFEGSGAAAK